MTYTLAEFGTLDWIVIGAYMLVMLGIGLIASRGQENEETYFLGGRKIPTWAASLSVLATALSAATFIGAPQVGLKSDLTYLILNAGGIIGTIVVAFFFIPAFYKAGTVTIYGFLGQRMGQGRDDRFVVNIPGRQTAIVGISVLHGGSGVRAAAVWFG